ncbi:MAG: DinB family protein, partial [Caldimonas sp.]
MNLLDHVRTAARANRLANHRLHSAMLTLAPGEFEAVRSGFFPSVAGTLNHLLAVDLYYIAALHREADMVAQYERFVPCRDVAELAERQRASDERLIAFVDSLGADDLSAQVVMDRGKTRQV